MVSPLVAWAIVILSFSLTGMLFLASDPIINVIYTNLYSEIPSEGAPTINMLKLMFYAIPVAWNVGLFIWAFLVTTRRQTVVRGYV